MFSLRAGGAALACPHARRRLAELSEAQLHEVSARLQKIRSQHRPSMDTGRGGAPGRLYGSIYMDDARKVSIEALQRIRDQRKDLMAGSSGRESAPVQTKRERRSQGMARAKAAAEWVGAGRTVQLGIHAGRARTMGKRHREPFAVSARLRGCGGPYCARFGYRPTHRHQAAGKNRLG